MTKTWLELLGRPVLGYTYSVYGSEIVATQDGRNYRVIWRTASSQHASTVLDLWMAEARQTAESLR